jgi:hypothetical protein
MPQHRKEPGTHLGHPDKARDAKRAQWAKKLPKDSHVGALQPKLNPNWHKFVKAWWIAIGMSDTAAVYQEIDWVNCWVCADVLQQMYEDGFTAGLLKEWHAMVEKLHIARIDLLEEQPEANESRDEDEERAEAAILDLRGRLGG